MPRSFCTCVNFVPYRHSNPPLINMILKTKLLSLLNTDLIYIYNFDSKLSFDVIST